MRELLGQVFTLKFQKDFFFNNLLDLVVMLEFAVFFYCQSQAKPHVLMSVYCNLMLLDIKSFLLDIHLNIFICFHICQKLP